jgi:hypothetical protein
MFDDISAYYQENVVASYADYRDLCEDGLAGTSRDLRGALTAASALFHFREHLPNAAPTRRKVEQLCSDYGLLGDVVHASKHKSLTANTPHGAPLVNDAESLTERFLSIWYEDENGAYSYTAKTVVINLIDGTERYLHEVLTNVINFWEQHLTSLGTISEARVFIFPSPVRARTRAECEENKLGFKIVQGHRFRMSRHMLRFNNETGQAEPIDLTGVGINLRVYKLKFDVDVRLTHKVTGKEYKKTLTLSESESLELSRLTSDIEKQAFVNNLPEAESALRQLAIEAELVKK